LYTINLALYVIDIRYPTSALLLSEHFSLLTNFVTVEKHACYIDLKAGAWPVLVERKSK